MGIPIRTQPAGSFKTMAAIAGGTASNDHTVDPESPAAIGAGATPTEEINAGSPSGTNDHLVRLKYLVRLRDAGVVTDEEFAAKKGEILAGM